MKKKMLEAALLHFKAEKKKQEVNLEIYAKAAVGVAEHPDIVSETIELIKKIAEADECIQIIEEKLIKDSK